MKVKVDMHNGEQYDPARHTVPAIYWSDGRRVYWGWIYRGGEIVGDFTAEAAQDAEKALGVRFQYD